jgi:hypothetical protein
MASTTYTLTEDKGRHPFVVDLDVAASTRILGGTMVPRDADGRACADFDEGYSIAGVANATVDNSSGAAGDKQAHLKLGIYGYAAESGNEPAVGDDCYAVDNNTVSTSATGGRGFAGVCVEVGPDQSGVTKYWVLISPETSASGGSVRVLEVDFAYDDADVAVAALTMTRTLTTLPAGAYVLGAHAVTSADWTDGAGGAFELELGNGTDTDYYADDVGAIDDGASDNSYAINKGLSTAGSVVATITGDANLNTLTGGATKVFLAIAV